MDGPLYMADINECQTGTHDCDVNADCQNADGSWNCVCKIGYSGSGTACTGENYYLLLFTKDSHIIWYQNN